MKSKLCKNCGYHFIEDIYFGGFCSRSCQDYFMSKTSNHSQEKNSTNLLNCASPDTSNFFARRLKEIEKGCGDEFIWISSLNDKRKCGQMEDLKHSDHILLCWHCKAQKQILLECMDAVGKAIDEMIKTLYECNCGKEKHVNIINRIEELKSKLFGDM